jgi:membrane-associated protease RseP (regulator of RpoE activity)
MSEQTLPPVLSIHPEDSDRQAQSELMIAMARQIVDGDLAIDTIQTPRNPLHDPLVLRGVLRRPSHQVFNRWLAAFNRQGYTPFLAPDGQRGQKGAVGDAVILEVVPGTVPRTPSNPMINLVLFVVTVISTLLVGALYGDLDLDPRAFDNQWQVFWHILTTPAILFSGWPFAATLLGILTAHEFGHYFAARYHKVAVTLPYFIPMPLGFGTLGAFIRLKEPVPDRRKLFDIGVAGPLAGLVLAVPLLFLGLATSPVEVPPPMPGALLEGNSLLYYYAKVWVLGQALPDPVTGLDVIMNRVTFAAWIGLLVTALNLLPLGQLDGGHTVFALFGRRARVINVAALIGMLSLGVAGISAVQANFPALVSVGWTGWFLWLVLINLLGGPFHPPALDDVTQLDSRRHWVGYFVLLVFIVTFVPVPLRPVW